MLTLLCRKCSLSFWWLKLNYNPNGQFVCVNDGGDCNNKVDYDLNLLN